ncbi:unnamed protein product [marine sediment metagenome]|uniref:Uncharacterized protein n=1 Tax=marine sediment metagenome TaxID=412755 RepID=X1RPX3_9ZZZZ
MKELISEIIIRAVREESKGDQAIEGFLVNLLFEEARHPEVWQFKKPYMKKIEERSKEWQGHNED